MFNGRSKKNRIANMDVLSLQMILSTTAYQEGFVNSWFYNAHRFFDKVKIKKTCSAGGFCPQVCGKDGFCCNIDDNKSCPHQLLKTILLTQPSDINEFKCVKPGVLHFIKIGIKVGPTRLSTNWVRVIRAERFRS